MHTNGFSKQSMLTNEIGKCMHAATLIKAIAPALGQHNKMRQTLARRRCEFKFRKCTYYKFVFAKNKLRQFDVMKQKHVHRYQFHCLEQERTLHASVAVSNPQITEFLHFCFLPRRHRPLQINICNIF